MPTNRWVIAADVLGVALFAAVMMGGAKTGLFAALLLAAPLALGAMMALGPAEHDT